MEKGDERGFKKRRDKRDGVCQEDGIDIYEEREKETDFENLGNKKKFNQMFVGEGED